MNSGRIIKNNHMKQFLKLVLATITGGTILMGILFLVLFAIAMSAGMDKKSEKLPAETVLHMKLNYSMNDRTPSDPFRAFLPMNNDYSPPIGLHSIIKTLEIAKEDADVKGIFLDLSYVDFGYAKSTELREALKSFKESGKFIYSYSEAYYNKTYYLSAVSDSIFINPMGAFIFNGMVADVTFYTETLKKLGIEMQVIRRGKFKGAVEPFVANSLSPENREQINVFIQSIYRNMLSDLSEDRSIPADSLHAIANDMRIRDAEGAVTHGLADAVYYRDQVIEHMRKRMGLGDKKFTLMSLGKYSQNSEKASKKGKKSKDKIAVIYANGNVVNGKGEKDQSIGGNTFAEALKQARKDKNVKAVVLRVNSRGGSALASDVIWRETKLLSQEKPLIVSMGDVAASGGYYIACLADTIVASPNTITGSIGVFGLIPNIEKLNEKLGLHSEYVGTGDMSEFGRIDRKMPEQDLAVFDHSIGMIYETFKQRVSEGRGMSIDSVHQIAQGRVWTGEMAKNIGLIDIEGGLVKAIDIAAEKSGLEAYTLVDYPKRKSHFSEIFNMFGMGQISDEMIKEYVGSHYTTLKNIKDLQKASKIQVALPFFIEIK
jgi:protease IV